MVQRRTSDSFEELKRKVEAQSEVSELDRCIVVLMAVAEVGPDVELLIARTGYSREFIQKIDQRMRQAGLWVDNKIDNDEWWDWQGQFLMDGLYANACLAEGRYTRQWT